MALSPYDLSCWWDVKHKHNISKPEKTEYLANSCLTKSAFFLFICRYLPLQTSLQLRTVTVLKFGTLLFLFSNQVLVIRAGIYKMHVKIANRDDPDQTASSEAV